MCDAVRARRLARIGGIFRALPLLSSVERDVEEIREDTAS